MKYIYVITFLNKLDWHLAFSKKKEAYVVKDLLYGNDKEARVIELELKDITRALEGD